MEGLEAEATRPCVWLLKRSSPAGKTEGGTWKDRERHRHAGRNAALALRPRWFRETARPPPPKKAFAKANLQAHGFDPGDAVCARPVVGWTGRLTALERTMRPSKCRHAMSCRVRNSL